MIVAVGAGEAILGAGVVVLLVLLALIVGWRRDKLTRSVRAGVFLERDRYDGDELSELGRRRLGLDPPEDGDEPEPRWRPTD